MARTKRIYDEPTDDDGIRVLADRLWPRGVSKEDARLDDWAKELAPSDELRRWYHHDPARFEKFAERYRAELENRPDLSDWRERASHQTVTLLTASKDLEHAHVSVLAQVLTETD